MQAHNVSQKPNSRTLARRDSHALERRDFLWLASTLAGGAALASLCGCTPTNTDAQTSSTGDSSNISSTTLFFFDTAITIQAQCSQETLNTLTEQCQTFESTLSRTLEGSDIWNINHAQGAPVEVASNTAEVISLALDIAKETNGLFDITIGSVSALWDFVEGIKPNDDTIAEALTHVGYENVIVENNTVTLKDPKAALDLGGIAKGYITDKLVETLTNAGCEHAVLDLGGNVYVLGSSFDGDAWNVGVQNPMQNTSQDATQSDTTIAMVACEDTSVITSGIYERSFEQNGELYHHILDPRTGHPAATDLVSATLLGTPSYKADALATALIIMGHSEASALLAQEATFEALLVDEAGLLDTAAGPDFVVSTSK